MDRNQILILFYKKINLYCSNYLYTRYFIYFNTLHRLCYLIPLFNLRQHCTETWSLNHSSTVADCRYCIFTIHFLFNYFDFSDDSCDFARVVDDFRDKLLASGRHVTLKKRKWKVINSFRSFSYGMIIGYWFVRFSLVSLFGWCELLFLLFDPEFCNLLSSVV